MPDVQLEPGDDWPGPPGELLTDRHYYLHESNPITTEQIAVAGAQEHLHFFPNSTAMIHFHKPPAMDPDAECVEDCYEVTPAEEE